MAANPIIRRAIRRGLARIQGLALAAIGCALVLPSPPAASQTATITALTGQSCAGTRFGQTLGCTANDFSSNLTFDQPSATALASCIAGQTVSINVIAQITSNSPIRYDGAYFIGEAANNPELDDATESCSLGVFPTSPSPFLNLDSDSCGDYAFNASSTLLIQNVSLTCAPASGTNQLAIPYTLVFNNQAGGATCTAANVTANTKSKCISSTTATVTGVTVNGYLQITKQTLPDNDAQSFSFSASASGGAVASPSAFALTDNQTQIVQAPFASGGGAVTLTVSEAATADWYANASIACTSPTGGSAASYVSVNPATRTITATLSPTNYGALCTITNTKIPKVRLRKTTIGGTGGPFTFAQTNLSAVPGAITTTAAGTPQPDSPPAINVVATGTAVTITETPASGFVTTGASCTDANAAVTGNAGTIGALSGSTLTIPAANVVPGADFTCTFVNTKLPRLTLRKISNGFTGAFTFSGTNGWASQTVTTSTSGVASSGAAQTLAAFATSTSVTETPSTAFVLASATCTGMGAGGNATLAGNVLTLDAAATAAGAEILCTFVNDAAAPSLAVTKTANIATVSAAGTTIAYTIAIANTGNVTVTGLTVSDPLGSVTCTLSGNATIVALVPGSSESCALSYVVPQAVLDGRGGGDDDIDNTATAAGNYAGSPVSASGTASVALVISPALNIVKSANTSGPVAAGTSIIYSYRVTNTGNVTMTDVSVGDVHNGYNSFPAPSGETLAMDVPPSGDSSDATAGNGVWSVLAPGDSVDFTAPYTVNQSDIDLLQ